MGEFTRSNSAHGKTLIFALADTFTVTNFVIAINSAFVGFIILNIFEINFRRQIPECTTPAGTICKPMLRPTAIVKAWGYAG